MTDEPFQKLGVQIPLYGNDFLWKGKLNYNTINGVPALTSNAEYSLTSANEAGVNTVSHWLQYTVESLDGSTFALPEFQGGGVATREEIAQIFELEASYGFSQEVMLALDTKDWDNGTTGQNREFVPTDPALFFENYTAVVMDWGRFFESYGIETFVIGTETPSLFNNPEYREYWADLISNLRTVFSGQVMVNDNWRPGMESQIWDLVDGIGLSVYEWLPVTIDATYEDMLAGWSDSGAVDEILAFYQPLSEALDIPVYFAEWGVQSHDGTAMRPIYENWWLPETYLVDNPEGVSPDWQEQADYVDAHLNVWSEVAGDWLGGGNLVNWWSTSLGYMHPMPRWGDENFEDGWTYSTELGTAWRPGSVSYTILDRPAASVVAEHFLGQRQTTATVIGSVNSDHLIRGYHHDLVDAGAGNDIIEGFAGNDILIGGPEQISPLTQTTIDVVVNGRYAQGEGGSLQIEVNDALLSDIFIPSAPDSGSGYLQDYAVYRDQTFTFTFENPTEINKIGLFTTNRYWNSAEDHRYMEIHSVRVNGTELDLFSAQDIDDWDWQSPTGDIHLHGVYEPIYFDVSSDQELFFGQSSDRDSLYGGLGNDRLYGGYDDDYLDGGDGLDTVWYDAALSVYRLEILDDRFVITDTAGEDGEDTLISIERLQFTDTSVALDFAKGQSGYNSATLIGTAFGAEYIDDYFAIGLSFFDANKSAAEIAQLIADNRLIERIVGDSNEAWVAHVYENVVGVSPDDAALALYAGYLDNGDFTKAELLALAQGVASIEQQVDIVGLQSSGLEYTPVG